MKVITRSHLVLGLVVVLFATACDVGSTATTSSTMPADGMAMNMGDPTATPAGDVAGAELVEGPFVLLETRPEGYEGVSGTAALALHEGGTTVTIRLTNMISGVDYISHVHEGSCAESGGDHYKFDPAGSDLPPNEIHLAFTAATDGTAIMTAENLQAATGARSVVVHPRDDLDCKIACAEFGG